MTTEDRQDQIQPADPAAPEAVELTDQEVAAFSGGATAIEYGLIASLISVAVVTGVQNLGSKTSSTFTKVSEGLK